MGHVMPLNRRSFITAALAAGGGLSLGWSVPQAAAQSGGFMPPAWVTTFKPG